MIRRELLRVFNRLFSKSSFLIIRLVIYKGFLAACPFGSDCTRWPDPGLCSLTGLEAALAAKALRSNLLRRRNGLQHSPTTISIPRWIVGS